MPLPEVQARMPGRAVAVLASVHVSGGKVELCGLHSISALGCFGPETPGGRACSRTCFLITHHTRGEDCPQPGSQQEANCSVHAKLGDAGSASTGAFPPEHGGRVNLQTATNI